MFVTYCYELAGPSPSFVPRPTATPTARTSSTTRAPAVTASKLGDPRAGDLVLYDWSGGDVDHIGLFETWTGGRTFQAIEGNTSTSNDSNGGQVMRRQRDAATTEVYFVRVAEP